MERIETNFVIYIMFALRMYKHTYIMTSKIHLPCMNNRCNYCKMASILISKLIIRSF